MAAPGGRFFFLYLSLSSTGKVANMMALVHACIGEQGHCTCQFIGAFSVVADVSGQGWQAFFLLHSLPACSLPHHVSSIHCPSSQPTPSTNTSASTRPAAIRGSSSAGRFNDTPTSSTSGQAQLHLSNLSNLSNLSREPSTSSRHFSNLSSHLGNLTLPSSTSTSRVG